MCGTAGEGPVGGLTEDVTAAVVTVGKEEIINHDNQQPLYPPTPTIAHLTNDEIDVVVVVVVVVVVFAAAAAVADVVYSDRSVTFDEIEALNDVFSRMELFEAEESARIRYTDKFLYGYTIVVI